jgi:hypothetical protein
MMTPAEVAQIIGSVGGFFTGTGAFIFAFRSLRVSQNNSTKIEAVHESTNGKMEELLNVTRAAAEARGVIVGKGQKRAQQRAAKRRS